MAYSSSSSPVDPDQPDAGERFKEKVKRWREEAILQTVADLLAEQGCQRFTMEDVAKRVGIAKRSLYLHTNARSRLVAQVLDRWLKEVPTPANASRIPMTQRWTALLKAILGVGKPEDDRATGRFPCRLHMSPCPQGWQDRWGELSRAYELSGPAPALDTEPG